MLQILSPDEQMTNLIGSSYRNFHAKGVDYICLRRSEDLTVKAYFFDGISGSMPEVVCPHDHRYDFSTQVLSGALWNAIWQESSIGSKSYHRFAFHTPLNGGDGFVWEKDVSLSHHAMVPYYPGDRYTCGFDAIHTLSDVEPGTVLLLWQYHDVIPVEIPSHTYSRNREPPSLSGLYEKHSADQIIARLRQLEYLNPGICSRHALHKIAGVDFVPEKSCVSNVAA